MALMLAAVSALTCGVCELVPKWRKARIEGSATRALQSWLSLSPPLLSQLLLLTLLRSSCNTSQRAWLLTNCCNGWDQ